MLAAQLDGEHTASNLPGSEHESHEAERPWEMAANRSPLVRCFDALRFERCGEQEHGGRHFRREQDVGRPTGGTCEIVQGYAEELAGRKELHSRHQESRVA